MCLLVASQRKGRRLVALQRMAPFAGVKVRRSGELSIVLVFVAIGAARKLNLEKRVFPFGDMTFRALHREVLSLQGVRRGRMLFRRERRRLESFHRVAARALRASRTLGELPIVWILLVAIHACSECDRFFEISASMALRAINACMLAL